MLSTEHMDKLRYLDNYRLILEKRIRDLAPSHPLPVLPSHCGQPNPDLEELQARLRYQLTDSNGSVDLHYYRGQLDLLTESKNQLEAALRRETLSNEE